MENENTSPIEEPKAKKPAWQGNTDVLMLRNYQADEYTRLDRGTVQSLSAKLASELTGKDIASRDALDKKRAQDEAIKKAGYDAIRAKAEKDARKKLTGKE